MTNEPNTPRPPEIPGPPQHPHRPPQPGPPTGYEDLEGGFSPANILNKLLRKPLSLVHNLETSEDGAKLPSRLLLIAVASLAIFGLVVGNFSAGTQLWAAPLKIIGGVFFSALICLPSLYIFACLGGIDAKFRTVAGLLCCLVALTSLLLVGFAPVIWLFSVSSNSIGFLGFLLTALWVLCAGFGFTLVFRAGRALGMSGSGHLTIWCLVFLLVTLQMPTTLRPIIGESEQLLNLGEKRFFLQYWSQQITGELNGEGRDAEDLHE
jgi:hypothetical protein